MGTKQCCSKLTSKICPVRMNPKSSPITDNHGYNPKNFQILQWTDTEEFLPQGSFHKLENADLLISFWLKPLVQVYINEIFRPNKAFKPFHYPKIKGIFNQIKPDLDAWFKRFKMKYLIPKDKYRIRVISYKLDCLPSTEEDLDIYIPIFFMEWCIYPKTFIQKTNVKNIIFVNNIQFTTPSFTQYRAGCPEYNETESLILSTQERNFVYIRIVIHHEWFHYLDWIDDYSFEDDEWNKFNLPGFKYGKGGEYEREWIKLDKDTKGFINHYSTTAMEEDRAEIYQYLIGCPDEALNNKDEIVQNKCKRIKKLIMIFDKKESGAKRITSSRIEWITETDLCIKKLCFRGTCTRWKAVLYL